MRTPLNKESSAVAVMDDDKEQENTIGEANTNKTKLKEDLHTFFKSRRSMSVSDPYFKRKVADTFMGGVENPDEPKKKREFPEVCILKEAIAAITKLATELESNIEQNTKREIKQIAATLKKQTNALNTRLVTIWIEAHRYTNCEKTQTDATNLRDQSTQADEGMNRLNFEI